MTQIGDLVPKSGLYTEPGVVVEKNEEDGSVVIDTEPLTINKFHRYRNTTGLTLDEKNTFNEILDAIYQEEDDLTKLDMIQKEIEELKTDTSNKNIVRYLRNQQAQLIREVRKLPRVYNNDEAKLNL